MAMRILFVSIHIEESPRAVPLGAASVAAALKQQLDESHEILVMNAYLHEHADEILRRIISFGPDLVGFSIYLWNRELSLQTAALLKEALPGCRVIVGGPEPTARPGFYEALACIDSVIVGEGELKTAKLLDPSRGDVPGHPDLTTLPSPYLDGTIDLADHTGVLWELSRGCPFRCAFCFESRGETSLRRFSKMRISNELELFVKKGVREIFILDPTFNYHLPTAKGLLQLLLDTAPEVHYMMEIRAEFIDEELGDLLSGLDCALQIGLQSIHPDVLSRINRRFDAQQFSDHIYLLHEREVPYGFDLIYGLPGDTLEGFYESFDYAMGMVPNHLDIFPLAILPGTELYDRAEEYLITYDEEKEYLVCSTPTFSADDMAAAGAFTEKVVRLYNEGRAVTWFDIILSASGLTPSAFFQAAPPPYEGEEPFSYQGRAITDVYQAAGIPQLTDLAVDLVTYFHEEDARGADGQAVSVTTYRHDPLAVIELCEQGILSLEDIAGMVGEEETIIVSYLLEGEPALYYADRESARFITGETDNLEEEKLLELQEAGLLPDQSV